MLPLTAKELREIRALVQDHVQAFSIRILGPEATGSELEEIDRLVNAGILDRSAVSEIDPIRDVYLIGMLRQRLHQAHIDVMQASWEQIKDIVEHDPIPMSVPQRMALDYAKTWAGQYVSGLGNRMANEVVSLLNPEDDALRRQLQDLVEDETALALERNETASRLAATLAAKTGDWSRDWLRIANAEMQEAHEAGQAASIEADHGEDADVAKVPRPDACPKCKEAYLDENGEPRIFKLSELRANGTNVGRKQAEWLPVVGTMHPWCYCILVAVPKGFRFVGGQLQPGAKSPGPAHVPVMETPE